MQDDRSWQNLITEEAEKAQDLPLTEPIPVPCPFITGGMIEVVDGIVLVTAWIEMPNERRIVARMAMTQITGGGMQMSLDEALAVERMH